MAKSKQDLKKKEKKVKQEEFVEEETNKKVIAIIVIALIVVLGLIIGGVFYFNSKDDGNSNGDNTKKEKIVKGKTLEVLETDYDSLYVAMIDDVKPTLNIYGETYQTRVINATIFAKDNEKLKSVEYAFSDSNTVEPSYTKIKTTKKKYSKEVSYDTNTNNYKITYLWVKVTDNANNTKVITKEFITAEYVNDVAENVVVSGDLIINDSGTIVNNVKVKGNIYITKNVGLGEVTLNKVSVDKNIYVNGGGTNSINLNNIIVSKKIIVNNENHVRLNFINITNKIDIDLTTDTTLQTDEATANNINANVIGDITVLIDGKVNKLVVKGNGVVKTKESASDTAIMEYVDVTNAKNAKVLGYVKDTNYNIETNKDSMVSPVAKLEVTVDSRDTADVVFEINRNITVTRKTEQNVQLTYRQNIVELIHAIKTNNQAKIDELLEKFTSSDIIVIVSWKPSSLEPMRFIDPESQDFEIYSAVLDEIVENDGNSVPTEGNENIYEKGKEYTINPSQQTSGQEVKAKTIVIEKDPNSDKKYIYEQEEEAVQVEPVVQYD